MNRTRDGKLFGRCSVRLGYAAARLIAALTTASIAGSADAKPVCPANIAGNTFHWAIALCAVQAETDDYDSPDVQQCIERLMIRDKIKVWPDSNCKLNARYKREWCRQLVKSGVEHTVSTCTNSLYAIPRNVRKGYVGD
jgi:hypothetical protein